EVSTCHILDGLPSQLQIERRRKLIGRRRRHVIADESVPQGLLVLRALEGWIGVVAVAARFLILIRRKTRIAVESLGIDWKAGGSGFRDGLHALLCRGMHEIHGRPCRSSHLDGAAK